MTARGYDAVGGFDADAGDAEKHFVIRAVDLDREEFGMTERPGAFGVDVGVEVRVVAVDYLVGVKLVKAHQPVGLIEPVLAQERSRLVRPGQDGMVPDRNVRGEVDALHLISFIQAF